MLVVGISQLPAENGVLPGLGRECNSESGSENALEFRVAPGKTEVSSTTAAPRFWADPGKAMVDMIFLCFMGFEYLP